MLLQALADSAGERAPAGYAKKSVGFRLEISPQRLTATIASLHAEPASGARGKREAPPTDWVPNLTRSNNPPPLLACDNAPFVLGLPKVAKDPAKQPVEDAKAQAKNAAFVQLLRDYAEASGDPDATRIIEWYEAGMPGLQATLDNLPAALRQRLDQDLISVGVLRRQPLHRKPAAQAYWAERVLGGKGAVGVCLVCGESKPLVDTLPQSIVGRLVPATSTSNVALLSGNFPAAQRGATGKGLKSAPVCAECGLAVVDSFNRLAASETHRWGRYDDDRGTIWWLRGGDPQDEELAEQVDQPKPQWVSQFLNAVEQPARGTTARDIRADRFFALTFSGNVARLVIRGWIDLPLITMRDNAVRWFQDIAIDGGSDGPYSSIGTLASCLGTMVRRDGRWNEPAPDGAREQLLRIAFADVPIPSNFLPLAVARAKAEAARLGSDDGLTAAIARRRMHARVGLIKLILNRTTHQEAPLTTQLDPDRKDKPYLSGRLFAVRAALQRRAVPGVNATITDRYFERAVSNPASMEKTLATLANQHLAALRRKESGRGAAIVIERLITELESDMQDAPGRQSPEDEAAWICGYFQQRQHDFMKAKDYHDARKAGQPTPADDPNSTSDADTTMEGIDE